MNEIKEVVQTNETRQEETKRLYTHCIVSYASIEELQPLLSRTKHHAYIKHWATDEDESNSEHYHIIATFEREKSFAWVRKQVKSEQNTFTEPLKGDIEDVLEYFIHGGKSGHGHKYEKDEIVYDDISYWQKRAGTGEKEEDKNEAFMDDLLASDFSVEKMCRKYGRDFAKNMRKYVECREYILIIERGEYYKRTMQEEYLRLAEEGRNLL